MVCMSYKMKSRWVPHFVIAAISFKRKIDLDLETTQVLYVSFDRFLLAVESRDLSQADQSTIDHSSLTQYERNLKLKYFCVWNSDEIHSKNT